jgi:hypothetical protein
VYRCVKIDYRFKENSLILQDSPSVDNLSALALYITWLGLLISFL